MKLTAIRYRNFRNYSSYSLGDLGALTILVGPNAAGKTNLLEGISLVSALSSFRNAHGTALVKWGSEQALLDADMSDGNRQLTVSLAVEEGKSAYSLNGKKKSARELYGLLPAVSFVPDDLDLVKGPQKVKRATVDKVGIQISENYRQVKRDYEKILKQKNQLLKDGVAPDYLASVNDVLVSVAAHYCVLRSEIVERLCDSLASQHKTFTGKDECVGLSYYPSWLTPEELPMGEGEAYSFTREQAQERLQQVLKENEVQERERRKSLYGPQRDRIDFTIGGRDASLFASQGQQRSLVLGFKMAEVQFIEEKRRVRPLLLLDDVLSELDTERQSHMMHSIGGRTQTILTTTSTALLDDAIIEKAKVVNLV